MSSSTYENRIQTLIRQHINANVPSDTSAHLHETKISYFSFAVNIHCVFFPRSSSSRMHCLRFTHNFPAGGCRALSKVIINFSKAVGLAAVVLWRVVDFFQHLEFFEGVFKRGLRVTRLDKIELRCGFKNRGWRLS